MRVPDPLTTTTWSDSEDAAQESHPWVQATATLSSFMLGDLWRYSTCTLTASPLHPRQTAEAVAVVAASVLAQRAPSTWNEWAVTGARVARGWADDVRSIRTVPVNTRPPACASEPGRTRKSATK